MSLTEIRNETKNNDFVESTGENVMQTRVIIFCSG